MHKYEWDNASYFSVCGVFGIVFKEDHYAVEHLEEVRIGGCFVWDTMPLDYVFSI